MDRVILAGGNTDEELRKASGADLRADVPYLGRTMLDIVVAAVGQGAPPLIIGGPDGKYERQRPSGENFIESIEAALEVIEDSTFLMATVDLPFLQASHVNSFLSDCDPQVDLNYPIIPLQECEREFPMLKRTTLKFREGQFTGGNLALIRTEMMRKCLPVLRKAYGLRKQPLHLANMVGLTTLGRVALGQLVPQTLTIPSLEREIGAFLGMTVKAVITLHPSIGTDIDSAEQYLAITTAPV